VGFILAKYIIYTFNGCFSSSSIRVISGIVKPVQRIIFYLLTGTLMKRASDAFLCVYRYVAGHEGVDFYKRVDSLKAAALCGFSWAELSLR